MNILHITPHMGGGVGTVLLGWMEKIVAANDYSHEFVCLDTLNDKALKTIEELGVPFLQRGFETMEEVDHKISKADIVLVHWWDHPMLAAFFGDSMITIPPCRLAFWCHKNYAVPAQAVQYPDRFFDTSPVQGYGACIWSTGNMDRFLKIEPKGHAGFNIGTVVSPKLRPDFWDLCDKIKEAIPEARFTILGSNNSGFRTSKHFDLVGKVDDIAPYLAEMDVFGYPLRPDHYGTCEIALGEAMAAGVVPVVMNNSAEKIIYPGKPTTALYVDAILWLYEHPERRKAIAAEARYIAAGLYDIDTMIRAWNTVFEDMMKMPKTKKGAL